MLIQDKIKLDIYESALDDSDKSELIEMVESTDDINILNDVVDIIESTRLMREEEKKSQELKNEQNKYKDLVNEYRLKARKYGNLSSDESLSPNVRKRASELKEQSLKKADEYNKLADSAHIYI